MSAEMGTGTDDSAEVAEQVLEILAGVLKVPTDELRTRQTLAAFTWTSKAVLEALATLESEFGIEIDLRALHTQRTADDFVRLVNDALR